MKVAVVGGGPSAFACAASLASERGFSVDVFDAALTESDATGGSSVPAGLAAKKLFGSDLPYRSWPLGPTHQLQGKLPTSFMEGGLANVWGATFEVLSSPAWSSLPIVEDLKRAVEFLGSLAPTATAGTHQLSLSPALEYVMRHGSGAVSPTRLAIETEGERSCRSCGQCLTGCPYGSIWTPRGQWAKLKSVRKFDGFRITKVEGSRRSFRLVACTASGQLQTFETYETVVLAPGPVESFRILAESKFVAPHARLRETQVAFIPFFHRLSTRASSYTLSQLSVRTSRGLYAQLYGSSEEIVTRAKSQLRNLLPEFALRPIVNHISPAICYLPQDSSEEMSLSLVDGNVVGEVNGSNTPWSQSKKVLVAELRLALRGTGLLPLNALATRGAFGEGAHVGAWLPHGVGSDALGRPKMAPEGIHCVDSSVLPEILPGPITATVMANAIRIARHL